MAFDSEELNKRRILREKQRKVRQARLRQLRLKLLAAAAVLVACAGVIYSVSREQPLQPDTPPVQAETTAPTYAPPPPPTEKKDEPYTTIRLAAVGDLNVTDKIIAAGNLGTNFDQMFLDILPLLAEADLTVMNYEGTLVGAPYGSENASAPQELMTALARAGVDVVQLANSYSLRSGISGLGTTIQNVRMAGMEPVGVYPTPKEAKKSGGYTILNVGGLRVAVVAFTKGMDSMTVPPGNEGCINLLYTDYATHYQDVDTKAIQKVLKGVREEKPDVTVAMLHWGSEYNDAISDSQKEIRDLLLSEGVDVILGTHSHYVQEVEFDKDAGTIVCYSLGDFLSDGTQAGTEYSVAMEIEITRDNDTGITKVTDYTYTPIFISTDYDTVQPLRIREAMMAFENHYIDAISEDTYHAMEYALGRIQARLHPQTLAEAEAAS